MAFALEQAIDEAALRMNVDPIGWRNRWHRNPNRKRLYDWASGLEIWRNAKPPASQTGRYRRGVGVATGYWLYLWQPGSKVELKVKDGRIVASTGIQDIGTGSRTVIANIVAHEFGLEPHEIEVHIGDSNLSEGPGSGGSRTTASIVPPALLAIQKLKAAIEQNSKRKPIPGSNAPWRDMIAASPDISVSAVRPEDGKQLSPGVRSPLKEAGFMGIIFGWMMRRFSNLAIGAGVPSSVQVIEVEVDTWLGHVRVLNVHTGIAVGKIAAPALARSQASGSAGVRTGLRASALSPRYQRSQPTRASTRPIRALRLRRLASQRRKSVIWPRSAATSRSARAAGTIATRISPASRRADRIVPPAAAIISIALPSISAPAWPRIPRQWQRRYWPMRRQSPPTEGAG